MRKIVALLVLAVAGFFAAVAWADNGSPATGHIGICHHTGASRAHEWIFISPDASGVFDGHGKLKHQFEEDIIPAFTFVNAHGETISYPGHNLDERIGVNLEPDPNGPFTGAEILANQCKAPAATTTTATTTGTTTTGTTTTGTTTATTATTTTGTTTTGTTTGATTTTGTTTTTPVLTPPTKKKHRHHHPTQPLTPPTQLPHTT